MAATPPSLTDVTAVFSSVYEGKPIPILATVKCVAGNGISGANLQG